MRSADCAGKDLEALRGLLARHRGAMGVRLVIPIAGQGHQLALEAGADLRVSPTPALVSGLRASPLIKRLTYRET